MKRFFGIGLLILAATLLVGCDQTYNSKASYFDGKVLVEYQQQEARGTNDSITLTFYAPGPYHVAFSETPGKKGRSSRSTGVMPKDFDTTINETPRVQVITQSVIPDYLRVTITQHNVNEAHDFQ
jgi:hypothetical protein